MCFLNTDPSSLHCERGKSFVYVCLWEFLGCCKLGLRLGRGLHSCCGEASGNIFGGLYLCFLGLLVAAPLPNHLQTCLCGVQCLSKWTEVLGLSSSKIMSNERKEKKRVYFS